MYYLNKIVVGFLNPLGIALLMLVLTGIVCGFARHGRFLTRCLVVLTLGWFWFWSSGLVGRCIGLSIEREYPPQLAEALPAADAIVVLGGGVSENTNVCPYVDFCQGADRVYFGARLFKAGKAPKIYITCHSDAMMLVDLGVPKEAIEGPSKARNTEEEARLMAEKGVKKVLLVTSAWHMRRAKLMFERYAGEMQVIPSAADHEWTTLFAKPIEFKEFVPDPGTLAQNAILLKEIVGYWGYKWFR